MPICDQACLCQDAAQLAHPRSLISVFGVNPLDSTMSLYVRSQISRLLLVFAGVGLTSLQASEDSLCYIVFATYRCGSDISNCT